MSSPVVRWTSQKKGSVTYDTTHDPALTRRMSGSGWIAPTMADPASYRNKELMLPLLEDNPDTIVDPAADL